MTTPVKFTKAQQDQFWSNVTKTNYCWLWTGHKHSYGYGWFRGRLSHRISWELKHGPIPHGLDVCHQCDNPVCVNPGHLFVGTRAVNMQDAINKGRLPKGEKKTQAKLRSEQVLEILNTPLDVPHAALGKRYGVSRTLVRRIRSGVCWRHVQPPGMAKPRTVNGH